MPGSGRAHDKCRIITMLKRDLTLFHHSIWIARSVCVTAIDCRYADRTCYPDAMVEQGQVSFQHRDDSTLVVRPAAAWHLRGGLRRRCGLRRWSPALSPSLLRAVFSPLSSM